MAGGDTGLCMMQGSCHHHDAVSVTTDVVSVAINDPDPGQLIIHVHWSDVHTGRSVSMGFFDPRSTQMSTNSPQQPTLNWFTLDSEGNKNYQA